MFDYLLHTHFALWMNGVTSMSMELVSVTMYTHWKSTGNMFISSACNQHYRASVKTEVLMVTILNDYHREKIIYDALLGRYKEP